MMTNFEMFLVHVAWGAAAHGTFAPQLPDSEALTVAVGILGATVMPHAIYLHSGLTQSRAPANTDAGRCTLVRFSNIEVIVALTLAGLVNMAMLIMASGAFHAGHPDVAEIQTAYHTLTPLLGAGAAGVFLISLLASGISSSVVGTMAGQVIKIALAMLTCRRDIMEPFVNSRLTAITAIVGTATILVPNIILLLQTFGVAIPGLPNAG